MKVKNLFKEKRKNVQMNLLNLEQIDWQPNLSIKDKKLQMNSPIPIYKNSNLAPRLRGIKQKKLIIHPSSLMRFLLFYSPKPRSQVKILIYRNWAISTM